VHTGAGLGVYGARDVSYQAADTSCIGGQGYQGTPWPVRSMMVTNRNGGWYRADLSLFEVFFCDNGNRKAKTATERLR